MEERPRALLLKFPGTNCDRETKRALNEAGFDARTLPFARCGAPSIRRADLVVLAGGFSYGDYVMAGRLAQLHLRRKLGDSLERFHRQGGHLLGICNGFQILLRLGLLPEGSLVANRQRRFVCRWVELEADRSAGSPFEDCPPGFELPVAHGEGRFVASSQGRTRIDSAGLAVLRYRQNPNGSMDDVAGLRDETGRILGIMPHPERFVRADQHYDPDWRSPAGKTRGWGYVFFRSLRERVLEAPGALAARRFDDPVEATPGIEP